MANGRARKEEIRLSCASLEARFRPERLLGSGGFGRVLLARDLRLDRLVALKLLSIPAPDPEVLARFEREARLTAGLVHPHVVRVYDHGTTDEGGAWIAYELVEGEELGDRWARGNLGLADLARLGAEVAEALAAAHAAGVVHRDVKPANVLVRPDGAAVLADFGIARSSRDGTMATAEGILLGTPPFMAPELFQGIPVGPPCDLFGLAASLHFLVAGESVYGTEELGELVQVAAGRAQLPVSGAPEGPFGRVLARALDRDPTRRYPDAVALGAALRAAGEAERGRGSRRPGPSPEAATQAGPRPVPEAAATRRLGATSPAPPPPAPRAPGRRGRPARVAGAGALAVLVAVGWLHPAPLDLEVWRLLVEATLYDQSWAQVRLGQLSMDGERVARDGVAARRWLLRALENPIPNEHTARTLGTLYLDGAPGVLSDPARALSYLGQAVGAGDPHAVAPLASLLRREARTGQGAGVAWRLEEALLPPGSKGRPELTRLFVDFYLGDPASPAFSRARGLARLWAQPAAYSEGAGPPAAGVPFAVVARTLAGSLPWRLYGDPARRGDPLALSLLAIGIAAMSPEARAAAALPGEAPSWAAAMVLQVVQSGIPERAPEAGPARWLLARLAEGGQGMEPDPVLATRLRAAPGPAWDPASLEERGPPPDLGPPQAFPSLGLDREPLLEISPGAPRELSWLAMLRAEARRANTNVQEQLGAGLLKLALDHAQVEAPWRHRAHEAACFWLGRAAAQGSGRAAFRLYTGLEGRTPEDLRIQLLRYAAQRGSGLALVELAARGLPGGPGPPLEAAQLRSLAKHVLGRAEGWGWNHLGTQLVDGGPGFAPDPVLAAVCFQRAATIMEDPSPALAHLAGLYRFGKGFRPDPGQADRLEVRVSPR